MARGRIIKPEMWTSKRINSVSLEANLFFIAILNFCDDFGTIENCNRMLLGNCFPYREKLSERDIEKWKNELISVSLVANIEHNNKKLLAVVKWEKHQTIMNRTKRNNIDNSLSIQEVIETIKGLISASLGTNDVIEKRKEKIENKKGQIICQKNMLGEFKNIQLSNDELNKLNNHFTEGKTIAMIEKMSRYVEKNGKKYKNHYAALLDWFDKEEKQTAASCNEEQDLIKRYGV